MRLTREQADSLPWDARSLVLMYVRPSQPAMPVVSPFPSPPPPPLYEERRTVFQLIAFERSAFLLRGNFTCIWIILLCEGGRGPISPVRGMCARRAISDGGSFLSWGATDMVMGYFEVLRNSHKFRLPRKSGALIIKKSSTDIVERSYICQIVNKLKIFQLR